MPEEPVIIEKLIEQAEGGEGKPLGFEAKMLLKKISEMDNLPMPNAFVMKVMLLLRSENVKMKELVSEIERDQSLVAKILKLVNSGYYGLRNTVDTVERAVSLLGIINIKHVVYSATIMDFFSEDEQVEWNHSYSTSVLMQKLMKANQIPAASNLPMTMLLHDLGKVVLRRFSPKKYQMAFHMSQRDKKPLTLMELNQLNLHHAMVGGILLEKWQMPRDIIVPIIFHHAEETMPPDDLIVECAMVQLVNWIDCSARDMVCPMPNREMMKEAGFEEIDYDYWIHYGKELIDSIEGKEENEDDKRQNLSKKKMFYNSSEIPKQDMEKAEATQIQLEKKSERVAETGSHSIRKPIPPSAPEPKTNAEDATQKADLSGTQIIKLGEEEPKKEPEPEKKTATDKIKKVKTDSRLQDTKLQDTRLQDTKEGKMKTPPPEPKKKSLWERFVDFLKS